MGLISPKKLKGFLRTCGSSKMKTSDESKSVKININSLVTLFKEFRCEIDYREYRNLSIITGIPSLLIPICLAITYFIRDTTELFESIEISKLTILITTYLVLATSFLFYYFIAKKYKANQHNLLSIKYINQISLCRNRVSYKNKETMLELLKVEEKIINSKNLHSPLKLTSDELESLCGLIGSVISEEEIMKEKSKLDKKHLQPSMSLELQ